MIKSNTESEKIRESALEKIKTTNRFISITDKEGSSELDIMGYTPVDVLWLLECIKMDFLTKGIKSEKRKETE